MLSEDEHKIVDQVKEFVKQAFVKNPHYSFDDWTVMYDHSCQVAQMAEKIIMYVDCDQLLVIIGSLLHDIGKTYQVDVETLHTEHESFNLPVSESLIESLSLSSVRQEKLKRLVSFTDESTEMDVIKDADALALPADKRLYMLYIAWAHQKRLESSIERKLRKFDKLHFPVSQEIGSLLFPIMKKDWAEYRATHEGNSRNPSI